MPYGTAGVLAGSPVYVPPVAGVSLRGESSGTTGFGTISSFTIPRPVSMVSADIAVITVKVADADTAPTITGMTQRAFIDIGFSRWYVFTGNGFTGAGDFTVNYTATGAETRSGQCTVWGGAAHASVIVGATTYASSGGDGTNLAWASITTITEGMTLALMCKDYGNSGLPTSITPAHTQAGTNILGMQTWYVNDPVPGATGAVTGVMQAWFDFATVLIALPKAP